MRAINLADELAKQEIAINDYLSSSDEGKKDWVVQSLISLGIDSQNLKGKFEDRVLEQWLPALDDSLRQALQSNDTSILDSFMIFDSGMELDVNVEVKASRIPFVAETLDLSTECNNYTTSKETTVLNVYCNGKLNTRKITLTENIIFVICHNLDNVSGVGSVDLDIYSKYLQAYDIFDIFKHVAVGNIEYNVKGANALDESLMLSDYRDKLRGQESFLELLGRNGIDLEKKGNPEIVTGAQGDYIELTRSTKKVEVTEHSIKKTIVVYQAFNEAFKGKNIEQVTVKLEGDKGESPNGVFVDCSIRRVIVNSSVDIPLFVDCEIGELILVGDKLELQDSFTRCTFESIQGEDSLSIIKEGAFTDCSYSATSQVLNKLTLSSIRVLGDRAFDGSTELLSLGGRLKYNRVVGK